jgi:hypothetical protein
VGREREVVRQPRALQVRGLRGDEMRWDAWSSDVSSRIL